MYDGDYVLEGLHPVGHPIHQSQVLPKGGLATLVAINTTEPGLTASESKFRSS